MTMQDLNGRDDDGDAQPSSWRAVAAVTATIVGMVLAGGVAVIAFIESSPWIGVAALGLLGGASLAAHWGLRLFERDTIRRAFEERDRRWSGLFQREKRTLEARLWEVSPPPTHDAIDTDVAAIAEGLNTLAQAAAALIEQERSLRRKLGALSEKISTDETELADLRARAADSERAAAILAGRGRVQNDPYAPRIRGNGDAPALAVSRFAVPRGEDDGLRAVDAALQGHTDAETQRDKGQDEPHPGEASVEKRPLRAS